MTSWACLYCVCVCACVPMAFKGISFPIFPPCGGVSCSSTLGSELHTFRDAAAVLKGPTHHDR